jgi:hypothetical protein
MKHELERMKKKAEITYFKVLFLYFLGGTEDTHEVFPDCLRMRCILNTSMGP